MCVWCAGAQNAAISFLSISGTRLACADAAALSAVLIKFSALNHFDVSANPGLGGDGVAAVLGSLAGMHCRMREYVMQCNVCVCVQGLRTQPSRFSALQTRDLRVRMQLR